jgi:hypothetical protein
VLVRWIRGIISKMSDTHTNNTSTVFKAVNKLTGNSAPSYNKNSAGISNKKSKSEAW